MYTRAREESSDRSEGYGPGGEGAIRAGKVSLLDLLRRLDRYAFACQSHAVKSCGPSGSQDLAFCGVSSSYQRSAMAVAPARFGSIT